jgi:hypothetical protein
MKRICSSIGVIAFVIAAPLWADQQVTLKSGASLIGKVKIDGDAAVVTVDDSDLRVPLEDIDTIEAANADPERQAHRMLLAALEARLMNDADQEIIGVLAEAQRLAPEDPHITFWYASSLADAGYGQAASDMLERRKEAVFKAYPGMAEQLSKQIKKRVQMEKMPPALIERLDKLNASMKNLSESNDMRQLATVFRIVDQEERPIPTTAFRIQCNGQDENLEPFDDGYYLHTFNRHRSNQPENCHLSVVRPGLESKTFDFMGATNHVQDAGTFVVKQYDDSAKVPFRARVVDLKDKPIAGAKVSLQPTSDQGQTFGDAIPGQADAEGRVEMLLFPMRYNYNVQAEGFNGVGDTVNLNPGDTDTKAREHKLFPAIRGTIRVAWEATMMQGGGGKSTGESTLELGSPGGNQVQWLQPTQVKDRLDLQFQSMFFGYGPFGPPETWLREVEEEEAAEDESADAKARLKQFDDIKLADIEDLKEKLRAPRMVSGDQPGNPQAPKIVTTEAGKIYVGELQHRNPQTGQPLQIAFKVFVEELKVAE